MEVVLREGTFEDLIPIIPKRDAEQLDIFDTARAHLEYRAVLINTSRYAAYLRTRDGTISRIPARNASLLDIRFPDVYLEIACYEVKADHSQKIYIHRRYKLNPSKICKGCAAYLPMLDAWVSTDEAFLRRMPVPKDLSLSERVRDLISHILYGLRQCPIQAIIADPSKEIDYVYAIIDRSIFKIPVLHTSEYGKTCVVKFAAVDHLEGGAIYDFNLDEMKTAFDKHEAFVPRVGDYEFKLFGSLEDAQEVMSQINTAHTKKLLGITAREKEAAKLEYTNKIASLENQVGDLTRQNEALRKQVEVMAGLTRLSEEVKKREHTEEIQNLQIKKEQAKIEKADRDVASASLGYSTTAVKAASVIIPAIAGCLGIVAFKLGMLGAIPSVVQAAADFSTASLVSRSCECIKTLLSPVKTVVSVAADVVSSMASATWNGITSGISSIGSFISGWF